MAAASNEPQRTGSKTGAQAIERAIAILTCFDGSSDLGVSELAEQVGITVSTAHRIVRALVAGGLLDQDPDTERYHLGLTTAVLGQLALDRLGLSRAAPAVEALAADTGEAVNLGVRVADDVLVVLHVPSTHPLRFEQRTGTRVPLHASAMGKALLAFGEQPPALDGYDYHRYTSSSITSAGRLSAALEGVRERGYAVNDEERNVGVRAVAVPVLDGRRRAVAAIAIQGPTVRLDDRRIPKLAKSLRATARQVGITTR